MCASVPNAQPLQEPTELTRFTLVEYHMGIDARLVVYATDKLVVKGMRGRVQANSRTRRNHE